MSFSHPGTFLAASAPDQPGIELLAGGLPWPAWSVGPDNPGNLADVGVISNPAAANSPVTLHDSSNGSGAARRPAPA